MHIFSSMGEYQWRSWWHPPVVDLDLFWDFSTSTKPSRCQWSYRGRTEESFYADYEDFPGKMTPVFEKKKKNEIYWLLFFAISELFSFQRPNTDLKMWWYYLKIENAGIFSVVVCYC